MKRSLLGGVFLAVGIAACSNKVQITPDTSGTGGSTTATMPGNTSSGTGAGAPGFAKVVTADTDMAQYEAFKADLLATTPVFQGPFFITDVFADNALTLFTVSGNDCSAPPTTLLVAPNGLNHFHNLRTPILAGQSLCHGANAGGTLTILGFRPY